MDFGCQKGVSWTPCGDPNRTKMGLRRLSRRLCFKNGVFHGNLQNLIEFQYIRAQEVPKIGPRGPQDGLKTALKRDRFLRRCSDDFWVPFGGPKSDKNQIKTTHAYMHACMHACVCACVRVFGIAPRGPQEALREPQEAPAGPQEAPKGSKRASRWP